MAPKVSEEHLQARKQQILTAAIACFAEKGFHKTSMKDIFTRADLSAGAVYSYFESKDEIIAAVCQSGDEHNRMIFQAMKDNEGDFTQQVNLTLGMYQEMLGHPDILQWLKADMMFFAEALTNPKLAELGSNNYKSVGKQLVEAIETWKSLGFIDKELDTKAIAQVFFSLIQGLGIQRVINPDLKVDAYFDVVKSLILGEFNTKNN